MDIMKNTLILNCFIIVSLLSIYSCDGDKPDPLVVRKALVTSSTWNVTTVSQSGVDITSAFTGATVTFQDNSNYSTTIDQTFNDIWPASGAWSLPNVDLLVVNGIDMTISSVTESSMSLTFISPNPVVRANGIDGDYVMVFTR